MKRNYLLRRKLGGYGIIIQIWIIIVVFLCKFCTHYSVLRTKTDISVSKKSRNSVRVDFSSLFLLLVGHTKHFSLVHLHCKKKKAPFKVWYCGILCSLWSFPPSLYFSLSLSVQVLNPAVAESCEK